jgi:predicted TIM-barrel fold metal-dependent hydrolase
VFHAGELTPGKMISESDLTEEDKRQILGENALKFFGLSKDKIAAPSQ